MSGGGHRTGAAPGPRGRTAGGREVCLAHREQGRRDRPANGDERHARIVPRPEPLRRACLIGPASPSLGEVKVSVPPPPDLEEVERAISALQGRHPAHERTRRETLAAAEERRQELARQHTALVRRRWRRALVVAANAAAIAIAATVAWRLAARAQRIRAELERAEAPFAAQGLVEIASNALSAAGTLEVDVPPSSCFVALTTGGVVRAREGAMSAEATGSVAWCACDSGRVALDAAGADPHIGIALMRIDAQSIGGTLARAWVPFTAGAWAEGGRECADAAFDGWVGEHRWPRPHLDESWLRASPARIGLRRQGFEMVSAVEKDRPFGIVEAAPATCLLAIAEGGDPLSLRATGGAWVLSRAGGAMVWCSSGPATTSVWRDGTAPVVVLAAPADRVGGLLGARECAEIAGVTVPPGGSSLPERDLAWDANALLRASRLVDVAQGSLPGEPGERDARVVALALSAGAIVATDPADAVFACDPPLGKASSTSESVCAVAGPISWWRRGEMTAAAARARLPFWLSTLELHHEPDAIARIPELLALSRRLARDGFEPTTLEGVTELGDGVRVVGRAGEDAVVAVGLGSKRPWAFPYTDAVPWDLGDPPRVVHLEPGQNVKLAASPPPNAPLDKRRTVVFRRVARP